MGILVSPTDKELARELGDSAVVSNIPEQKGADALIYTEQGLFGIQRKSIPGDFITSVNDGRLTRETSLLATECKFRLLLCEGEFKYYPDGTLVISSKVPGRYTFSHIQTILFTTKYVKGVDYDYTKDIEDTARYIKQVVRYFSENKHVSLFTRPNAPSDWYKPMVSDIHSWILQSFDGVGPVTADKIVKHFNRMPMRWDCTLEELQGVPGLTKKRAHEIYCILNEPGEVAGRESLADKLDRLVGKR